MAKQRRQLNRPRATARINAKLEKNLAAYMASAAAAGVSMLATPQLAQAKIVYTPANTAIESDTNIDLNHDGIPDFTLLFFGAYHTKFFDVAPLVKGNGIRDNGAGAAAGFLGVPVGGGEKFASNTSYFGHGVGMAALFSYSHTSFFGAWANVTNRYLGFKFLIDGQTHYGWARLSVTNNLRDIVLTGYAYETVPNQTILEGHTSGPEEASYFAPDLLAPSSQPAELGVLALGADGLAIWRREENETSA